eukprot:Pgem_evm1s3178
MNYFQLCLATFCFYTFEATVWNSDVTGYQGEFETCDLSHQDCSLTALRAKNKQDNMPGRGFILLPPNRFCYRGTKFGFQVFPGKTDKTWLHFQGGGVCYDYQNCKVSPSATQKFKALDKGIANREQKQNPSQDMTLVINNYCSGDVFVGMGTGNTTLTNPLNKTESASFIFQGYNNTLSVLAWIEANSKTFNDAYDPIANNTNKNKDNNNTTLTDLSIEIVSGSSAGSIGAQIWLDYLVNSYIGFFDDDAGDKLHSFAFCKILKVFNFSRSLYQKCKAGTIDNISQVLKENMDKHENQDVIYISADSDLFQQAFYALSGIIDYSNFFVNFVTDFLTPNFPKLQRKQLKEYQKLYKNFEFKLEKNDTRHCFLNQNAFYSDRYSGMLKFVTDF